MHTTFSILFISAVAAVVQDNKGDVLEKSNVVQTIPILSKSWTLTVDIKPMGTKSGWSNIVHASTGADISEYGSRVPGIWFHSGTSKLHICSAVNGNLNYIYDHPTALPIFIFTNVKVEQLQDDGKYVYRIYIGNEKVHEVVNTKPSNFENVKLYAADPWYNAANSLIRNLEFDNNGDVLEKSNVVQTIPILSKSWTLTVDIKPLETKSGWSNIVHASTRADISEYGSRVPGIWFHSGTSKLHICSAVNGNLNYIYDHPTALPMNEFTNVKVEQTLDDGKYFYRIYVGNEKVHEVVNTQAREFKNVKLYAADPWYNAANSLISNLEFGNKGDVLEKSNVVQTIPILSKSWTLTVDIKPLETKSGWSNIVHASTGADISEYGSRVPGIWFHSGTSKLHICSAVNGNLNYIYDHPTALPMNEFTNVQVEQLQDDGKYVYRIYIGNEKVHEVFNTKPSNFANVKLYAADPWYNAANSLIRNLEFGNKGDVLEKSNVVQTIPILSKSWTLTVDIKPLETKSGWSNIVHASTGADISEYGSRVPGIWFHSGTSKLHICSAVNGNLNYIYDHPTALPMNEFTNVKVEQTLDGGKYFYRIYVGDEKVHEVVNMQAREFKNVKLYAADPWYNAANSLISNLEFGNKGDVLEKSNVVQTIPILSKSWTLTVDIKPLGTKSGWSNIVHASTGADISEYGSRVPGIWFHSGTSKLHICSAVNGNLNYIYDHPTALPMLEFTNVKVEQVQDDGKYVYRIYIGNEKVHEVVNTKPSNFENVKLYAADPWYNAANSLIRNLEFVNQ